MGLFAAFSADNIARVTSLSLNDIVALLAAGWLEAWYGQLEREHQVVLGRYVLQHIL